jgi:hypothetical protein
MNRRLMLLGPSVAFLAGCADLLGVQDLSGGDVGADGGSDATYDAGGSDAPGDVRPGDAFSSDVIPGDASSGDDSSSDTSSGCNPVWVDASAGEVPVGAVPNGPLDAGFVDYVCRVPSGTASIPGKLLSPWYCYYSDGTTEVPAPDYQVLVPTGCAVAWEPAPSGVTPPYTFQCGQDSQGLALYSCRVEQGDAGTGDLGYMGWSTNHLCVYSNATQSFSSDTFDVLTVH